MGGDFIYRHHEEPRLKLNDPDDDSRFPSRCVDVMRHTERHTNNVAENTMDDLWTEAKGLNLPEVWTGTTRFHILRARLPERYKRVSGKPTEIKKQLPDETILGLKLGRSYPKKQRGKHYCRMGRRKCRTANSASQQENLRSLDW